MRRCVNESLSLLILPLLKSTFFTGRAYVKAHSVNVPDLASVIYPLCVEWRRATAYQYSLTSYNGLNYFSVGMTTVTAISSDDGDLLWS